MTMSQEGTIENSYSKIPLLAVSSTQSLAQSTELDNNLDSGEILVSAPSKIYDTESVNMRRN